MFKSGDQLIIDIQYIDCEGLRNSLRKFNSWRKIKKLKKVDPYQDTFYVVGAQPVDMFSKKEGLTFKDISLGLYLETDIFDKNNLFSKETFNKYRLLELPAFFFRPAKIKPQDDKDKELVARYLGYHYVCPICEVKPSTKFENNKIIAHCFKQPNNHKFRYVYDFGIEEYTLNITKGVVVSTYSSLSPADTKMIVKGTETVFRQIDKDKVICTQVIEKIKQFNLLS